VAIESKPENAVDRLTELTIGAAIEVHRHTGPGLMESIYEECLCHELALLGLAFQRQVPVPVVYKGIKLDCGHKMDILVESAIVLELKTVERLLPVHSAQLLTYLKMGGKEVGLLMNFNEAVLTKGLKRIVNRFQGPDPRELSKTRRLGVSAVNRWAVK
jgi:GxxExxY protein